MKNTRLAGNVIFIFILIAAAAGPAHADYYMRAKSMGGMQMETWAVDKKQRTQSTVPVMGQFIVITRLDKGVEWTVDAKSKIYQERPIALPYNKATIDENTVSSKDIEDIKGVPGSPVAQADCTPVIHEKGERQIAGFAAKGYYGACEEGNKTAGESTMIMWIAPASGDLAKMEKESEAYEKEHSRLMWSNYPPKERKEMEEGSKVLRDAFKMAFSSTKGVKIPKGVPLAMEMSGSREEAGGVFYEVTELKIQPVQQEIFDLPPGYTQVEDIAKEQAKQMMKGMGMDPDQMQAMLAGAPLPPEVSAQIKEDQRDREQNSNE